MEKIWTTVLIPPSVEEPELSSSAKKVISFLQKSEGKKFNGGFVEENRDVWLKPHRPSFYKNNQLFKGPINALCHIKRHQANANEKDYVVNHSYPSPLDTYSRQDNDSVDMFEDSSTSHGIAEVETNKKPIRNSINGNLSQENNGQTVHIDNKITKYFPIKKIKVSKPKNVYKINNACSFSNEVNLIKKTKNSTKVVRKDKFNTLDDFFQLNTEGDVIGKKRPRNFLNESITSSVKNAKNITNFNYLESSELNFYDLPKGTLKSIKELPCPTSPKTIEVTLANNEKPTFEGCLMNLESERGSGCENNNANEGINEASLNEVFFLNHDNIETTTNLLFHKDIETIGITLCYREEFCLLNKPNKNDKCSPTGLLICAKYSNDYKFIFFPTSGFKEECFRALIINVLSSSTQKNCYEAQACLIFVLDYIEAADKRDSYKWCIFDPKVAAWLLDPDHPPHSFDDILKFVSFSKNQQKKQHWLSECCDYLKHQIQAMEALCSQLHNNDLWDIYENLETKIIPLLAVLEMSSITINIEILKKMHTILQEKLYSLEEDAKKITGYSFSLKSPLQIRKVLYEELKLDHNNAIPRYKDTIEKEKKSTSESELKWLGKIHPLPLIILEHRQLWKILSYIETILQYADKKKGVTATWELCATATGRIISSCPNLQSIPKKPINIKIEGKEIVFNLRSCFEARKTFIFVAADFQHIELRILAHLAKDKALTDLLLRNDDIFKLMTQIRLKQDSVTKNERDQTKTLIYALMYGAGIKRLANIMSVEESEAHRIKSSLSGIFPAIQNFREKILNDVRKSKVLISLSGRRRLFPAILSKNLGLRGSIERKAINFVIQGSAADICKFTMLRMEMKLKDKLVNARLLLQIHDELLWEVEEIHYHHMISILKEVMEENKCYWLKQFNFKIPLPIVITSGYNWGCMTEIA